MPFHTQSREGLWIQLEEDQGWFAPGETIHGAIRYSGPMATSPRTRISLTLYGSSECQISLDGGRATSLDTHTSTFDLVDPEILEKVVFDEPAGTDHSEDHAAWPFAFTIPRVADGVTLFDSEDGDGDVSYTPLGRSDQRLPNSFALVGQTLGMRLETHVEYYLEARFEVDGSNGTDVTTTLPIYIQTPNSGPPIKDCALRCHRHNESYRFRSHHLAAGQENSKLSLSQKLQHRFHSRSVPRLGVEYEVEAPHKIQLDNPAPIQLLLRAIPDWTRTSWDIHGVPQRIRVDSVRVRITADTEGLAMGPWDCSDMKIREQTVMESLRSFKGEELYVKLAHDNPTLDLGESMNIRYHTGDGDLYPDFEAFNISHGNHHLEWRISVSFAGEEHEINGSQSVRILPPSGDTRREFVVRPARRLLVGREKKGLLRLSNLEKYGGNVWMRSRGVAEAQGHLHVCGG